MTSSTTTGRFAFGRNWRSFLEVVDEGRIEESQHALQSSLGRERLDGWRVLDIGSGSGLSSLAMYRLGAKVVSFDFDQDSVICTHDLRERHAGESGSDWQVFAGSVLDGEFMRGLGDFDLVYAWGALHHTGRMWLAVDNAAARVKPGGVLLLALYNDQGWRSRAWWWIKRTYCAGWAGRALVGAIFYPLFAAYAFTLDLRNGQRPGTHAREYRRNRGMSLFHDWRDWLGGFPFEVAGPDVLHAHLAALGFEPVKELLAPGWGCNEFVHRRSDDRGD
ncbi:MAG TPA: class I SAM-dependent methyltransferase [Luteimonas sp.]|nr:class I SAM-dependent methyltransferase [Luteimonas sp.]